MNKSVLVWVKCYDMIIINDINLFCLARDQWKMQKSYWVPDNPIMILDEDHNIFFITPDSDNIYLLSSNHISIIVEDFLM